MSGESAQCLFGHIFQHTTVPRPAIGRELGHEALKGRSDFRTLMLHARQAVDGKAVTLVWLSAVTEEEPHRPEV